MIGKISKGAGFRGCVNYVLGKPDAKLLAAEGVLTDSIQTITDCFQSQRMMKPHIRQPVGHISLSYAPEDASRMTDEILVSLAKEYMQKMGIKETQYIIARVVASKSVTEASKGALRTIGNRPQSVMAKGRLTGRQTSRAGRKLEHSDPVFPYGRDIAQRIKGTPGITG